MPTFFIAPEDITPPTIRIAGPLLQHLHKSLRLQRGESLTLTSPEGIRYFVEVTESTSQAIHTRILNQKAAPPRATPQIVLGQALLKGERMDWVIQKASELGAASLVPLVSRHVIVRPRADRLTAQQQRWQRIALEAAQQAERWEVPVVHTTREAMVFFAEQPAGTIRLFLSERADGAGLASVGLPRGPEGRVTIAVGPEGGWTKEERESALHHGFTPVTLGPRILRAETATLAALTILQSRLGELG